MTKKTDGPGEGNRKADQRYRKGVRETVEETSEKARAEKARNLSEDQKKSARDAESKGKARARR